MVKVVTAEQIAEFKLFTRNQYHSQGEFWTSFARSGRTPSHRVGADAGFAAGEGVADSVQSFIPGVVILAEGAEVVLAGPAVDGQIGAGEISIAQELGSQIFGRRAKELRPGAVGPIGSLKGSDLLFGNLKLPCDHEHPGLRS